MELGGQCIRKLELMLLILDVFYDKIYIVGIYVVTAIPLNVVIKRKLTSGPCAFPTPKYN